MGGSLLQIVQLFRAEDMPAQHAHPCMHRRMHPCHTVLESGAPVCQPAVALQACTASGFAHTVLWEACKALLASLIELVHA